VRAKSSAPQSRNEELPKEYPDGTSLASVDTAVINSIDQRRERNDMKALKIRLTLLAVIAATTIVALLPGTAAAGGYVSDRMKKDAIVPVEW
jgi:hypothetical protein